MPVTNLVRNPLKRGKDPEPREHINHSDDDVESSDPEHNPTRQKRRKYDPTSPLCAECQAFDVDNYFDKALGVLQDYRNGDLNPRLKPRSTPVRAPNGSWYFEDAVPIHYFGDRLTPDTKCPMCQFFRQMRVQPDQHEKYKLLALPSSESWLFQLDLLKEWGEMWDKVEDSVFMIVVPDLEWLPPPGHEHTWMEKDVPSVGMICRWEAVRLDVEELMRPRELGHEANLRLVRGWLDDCKEKHGNACRSRTSDDVVERGFRVIDCEADPPKVEVQPWGVPYAALSYVWGTSSADQVEWPKTVLDAVSATKDIGLRYLWVDRLCINQADVDEKAYLISKMAAIYEAAEITIVAAAGDGASHGLPGIRDTPRRQQPRYTLDSGNMLVSTLGDPRRDIIESSHWTRGWTYQEGILSNRRIVFTEHQVYWECRNMAAQESVDIKLFHRFSQLGDLQAGEEEDGGRGGIRIGWQEHKDEELVMADFMLGGIFKGDASNGGPFYSEENSTHTSGDDPYRLDYGFPPHLRASLRAQLRGLNEHVRAYSNRRLTHGTDALPAFMGITSMYRTFPELYLLHGLPLYLKGSAPACSTTQITFAMSASGWYHRSGVHPETNFISEPCARRTHLPSWTWAGWEGPVSWRAPPQIEHCSNMTDMIEAISANQPPHPLWAAEFHLFNSAPLKSDNLPTRTIKLRDCHTPKDLDTEQPDAIVLQNPYVLKYSARHEVANSKKGWDWMARAGRAGSRSVMTDEAVSWDRKQYRIAGRLSFVALSVEMTEEEWTKKHTDGELVSVLMYATRWNPEESSGHGGAHFMTLRKVRDFRGGASIWERVGVLYLVIPKVSLDKCGRGDDLLKQAPVERREMTVIIE
ncbi:heterokaryon incompatibility protein-domain-containing protein [Cercophora samala]|uniref:Heterokaryon incompatibility protein-domain-containing protein n=1 Tax=Cercophora samala TaxID=330535 RepID=A0AA39Z660_9PEZI|nr:heterokaryon incompatibility protein-domain-containing protein [Cercophora samala]